jgi:hypothetical protein
LLIVARTLVEIVVLRETLDPHAVRLLAPLLLFAIISLISIWVGMAFFQGKIMVMSSTAGLKLELAQPYTFQRQNLTQPFYLLLNLGIVYALAHQIARLPAAQITTTLDRAVLGAILFASLIAAWEMAHFHYDLPFFADFFHSNAGYSESHGQVLFGEILRVSGPFKEPSDVGYYFAGFLMYAWYRYLRRPGAGATAVVLLCITVLAVSTSTTAFGVLGIFAIVAVKDAIVGIATTRIRIKLSTSHVGVIAVLSIAAIAAVVFVEANWYYIDNVVRSMLLEKHHGSSFAQRSGADLMALDIVLKTGGIGIGLGSHKPNNLALTLLSNTGIAGFLVFAAFLFELLRPRQTPARNVDVRPFRWMAIGLLLVHLISNPNLNPIFLWISFALNIGALAAEWQAAGRRAVSTWRTPISAPGVAPGPLPQATKLWP